eukprot:m.106847 g.106847  ORF g.106847 m.106847 type:complete len:306 (+) comp15804_c1_seq3:152-1069(+)
MVRRTQVVLLVTVAAGLGFGVGFVLIALRAKGPAAYKTQADVDAGKAMAPRTWPQGLDDHAIPIGAARPKGYSPTCGQKPQNIIVGLGTGRCGTVTLTAALNGQQASVFTHEQVVQGSRFSWESGQKASRVKQQLALWKKQATQSGARFVGGVYYAYLAYLKEFLAADPCIRFVVLKRDRAAVVASYMRTTKGTNHWQPKDLWAKREAKGFAQTVWTNTYPKFVEATSKEDAVGMYWDYYYNAVDEWVDAYPDNFRVVESPAVFNNKQQLVALLRWCGFSTASIKASLPSLLGKAHNEKPQGRGS